MRLIGESTVPSQGGPTLFSFRGRAGEEALESHRLGQPLRTEADFPGEPALQRPLAPPDGPGQAMDRLLAARFEERLNRANGTRMRPSGRTQPVEEKLLELPERVSGRLR